MSRDPLAEQSAKLLAALDFGDELARRERQHRQALAALFGALLEVMDGFDRVLGGPGGGAAPTGPAAGPDEAAVVPRRTVGLLARQLRRCLEAAGVAAWRCIGEQADPERHEIAGVRATATAAPDTILEIETQGYLWHGELLRRPRVIVAAASKETRP
jgi:molecular chaperone GrpE (heat shock protein)